MVHKEIPECQDDIRESSIRTCDVPACDRRHEARGLCANHYQLARKAGNLPPPGPPRIRQAPDREKLNAYHRNYLRHYTYGLDRGVIPLLVESVGSRCQICATDLDVSSARIDHDHTCCTTRPGCGQCVRGILCNRCNTALGLFGDDPERLAQALAYLTGPRITIPVVITQ